MGFLDNLFGGGSKKRDATAAYNDSQATLQRGLQQAQDELRRSTDAAKSAISTGYDQAGTYYDRAAGLYERALPGLRDDLTQGFTGAEAALTGAADRANAVLDPYQRSGRAAQDLYDQALGVGGTGAQKSFYDNYAANDPFRAYRDELANKAIQRQFNATGMGTSGRVGMAVSRASLERGSQDLQQYLSRLESAGARGSQIAGQQGGNIMSAGQGVAQTRANMGQGLANLGLNVANAQSGILGSQAGLSARRADRMAGLDTGQGSALAGLISGNAQQSAANRINLGNAYAQTRGSGMQNLLGLAGTAANAFALYNNPLRKSA